MTTDKEIIRFYTNNEDLQKFIKSQKNQSEFIESILEAVRTGQLLPANQVSETKELDTEFKKLRNKHLGIKIQLDEKRLSYMGIFNSEPSHAATAAMQKGIEQRDFNESEYENVNKYITVKNHNFKWEIKCDICKEGETYDTRLEGIHEMIRHLTTEHAKKVMERRN